MSVVCVGDLDFGQIASLCVCVCVLPAEREGAGASNSRVSGHASDVCDGGGRPHGNNVQRDRQRVKLENYVLKLHCGRGAWGSFCVRCASMLAQ